MPWCSVTLALQFPVVPVQEAKLQAAGKSIQELAAEAEAEAEFEIAELFDDIGAANDIDPRDAR